MSLSFVSLRIREGTRWFELNDGARFKVEGSSFEETAQSYRRQTVESPYIGGRFVVNAVPDVVEETLVLWIYGQDQVDLDDNIELVVRLFSQFSYLLEMTYDTSKKRYECEMADYSISKTRELVHNNMAQIRLRVPRIPEFEREVLD